MPTDAEHVIEIDTEDLETDRVYWRCDCGAAGSCPAEMAEIHAEKHLGPDEGATYRSPGRRY